MATDRRDRERDPVQAPAPAITQPPVADDSTLVSAAIGNQAFGAVARTPVGPAFRPSVPPLPPTLAREPGGATAAPTASWNAPAGYGAASTTQQAMIPLFKIRTESTELAGAGFADLKIAADEAGTWMGNFTSGADRPLTADEVRKLTDFGNEFQGKQEKAVREVAQAIAAQLTSWISSKPINDDDLFELREAVHSQFNKSDKDMLTKASELLGKVEELTGEVEKWAGRGAKAKDYIQSAKKLEDIEKGVKEIKDKIGEAKKMVDLVRDISKMVGAIGNSPAGVDDIGAVEGMLGVMNFAISKAKIPGLTQLWDEYIYKLAKACLVQLRKVKEQLYKNDRGDAGMVKFFFVQHQGDATAPDIKGAAQHGDPAAHFPGGQPMLNFMWQLMRDPDSITSVPAAVEDFFVKWRKNMNAGQAEDNQLQSDSKASNLWNAFSRERAPNMVPWIKQNRDEAWVKLYGGMPKPR